MSSDKERNMIIYKCDGEKYSDNSKCIMEETNKLPETWFVISGTIQNGLPNARLIRADSIFHFCSRQCLENFLFKE